MYGKFCFTVDIIDVIDEDLFAPPTFLHIFLMTRFFPDRLIRKAPTRPGPDPTRPGPGPGPLEKDMDLIN